jgi:hypothetical protein
MIYKAKVAVCSEIRTKHINAMWAPRRIFLMLNLVVRKVIARLWKVKEITSYKERWKWRYGKAEAGGRENHDVTNLQGQVSVHI